MGKERSTTSTSSGSTTTVQADPSLTKMNAIDLATKEKTQPALEQLQLSGLDLGNLLLRGQNLPGYLGGLPGGISPEVTQELVDQSLGDVKSFANQGGILDSGVAASIAGRTAGDIRMNSAQFNLQNLQQLLNLALGGQAQVQQPVIGMSNALGTRLGGLSGQTTTGSTYGLTTAMNPFLKSFQQQAGKTLGGGQFSMSF